MFILSEIDIWTIALIFILATLVSATMRYRIDEARYQHHPWLALFDAIPEGVFAVLMLPITFAAMIFFRRVAGRDRKSTRLNSSHSS